MEAHTRASLGLSGKQEYITQTYESKSIVDECV